MPLSDRIVYEGLTFDDVMLVPARSNVLPVEALLATHFSRNVRLSIPLVSAAMDTVTESRMATALALEGGLGVIHRNLRPADQANQVAAVKTSAVDRTTHPLAAVDAGCSWPRPWAWATWTGPRPWCRPAWTAWCWTRPTATPRA